MYRSAPVFINRYDYKRLPLSLLKMQNISKSFSGTPANEDVSLEVHRGEVHALLGENGAGKTTLMNILYGIYPKDSGTILWKGREVCFQSPKEALENRIGMVHQHFMLVPTMTVSENITLGLKSPGYPFTNRAKLNQTIVSLSEKYGLEIDPEALVSSLSVGEEQRVEIIKLLYRNAELLILDEPTAVLTPQETEQFFRILDLLKEDGHAVILITHRIPEVLRISNTISILRDGKKISQLKTEETDSQELSRLMIGRELKLIKTQKCRQDFSSAPSGLDVQSLSYRENKETKLRDISFKIKAGEILGIAGVDGNGQKDLAECITGIKKTSRGRIDLKQQEITTLKISERYARGLAYISDDRHHDGLVLPMTMEENFLLNGQIRKQLSPGGFINYKGCKTAVQQAIKEFDIKTSGSESPIGHLSGGNQQKLILAREIKNNPDVVIAFQPTRGLDIGASEYIREQLVRLRERGSSILLISTDLDEILMLSDRVAVMFEGTIQGILENSPDLDMTEIGQLMAGQKADQRSMK
jgi:simple sugar transport system ATP-binding protein